MTPSAIVRDDTLDAPALEVGGPLSHAAIGERDLLAGRFDGARVAVFAVDWTDPAVPVPLAEGRIGGVETGRGGYTAELLGGRRGWTNRWSRRRRRGVVRRWATGGAGWRWRGGGGSRR